MSSRNNGLQLPRTIGNEKRPCVWGFAFQMSASSPNLPCASPLPRPTQAAYNIATSTLTMFPVCTKSTAVAIRAAIRRRVGQ